MNVIVCPHEDAVRKAAPAGLGEGALASHAAACPVCGEVAQVAVFLQVLARADEMEGPLLDPDVILHRARLADILGQREQASARAAGPVLLAEVATLSVVALGPFVWFLAAGRLPSLTGASGLPAAVLAALSGLAVLFTFSVLRAEEG